MVRSEKERKARRGDLRVHIIVLKQLLILFERRRSRITGLSKCERCFRDIPFAGDMDFFSLRGVHA
jgi:hypothetical protein